MGFKGVYITQTCYPDAGATLISLSLVFDTTWYDDIILSRFLGFLMISADVTSLSLKDIEFKVVSQN